MSIKNYDIIYFLITPTLGLLRDYSKNKNIIFSKFIRTPLMTFIISLYCNRTRENLFKIIIYERWLMLMYKTCYSLYKGPVKKIYNKINIE